MNNYLYIRIVISYLLIFIVVPSFGQLKNVLDRNGYIETLDSVRNYMISSDSHYGDIIKLSDSYCYVKSEDNLLADSFFDLISIPYTNRLHDQFRFFSKNYSCFSDVQKAKARNHLNLHLESDYYDFHRLVSLYGLESKVADLKLIQIDSLFEDIEQDLVQREFVSSINEEQLESYAILVNLGEVDESIYVGYIMKLLARYSEKHSQNSDVNRQYFYHILEHSLVHLISKTSIVNTLEILNVNDDLPPHYWEQQKGQECQLMPQTSLRKNYLQYCVKPKLDIARESSNQVIHLMYDSSLYELSFETLKGIILSDDLIWKNECFPDQ